MEKLAKILIGVGMAGAFFSLLLHLSGAHSWIWQATGGKEEGGHYYLKSHGNYREVSHSTFQCYLWQEYADMTGVCLIFCGLGVLLLKKRKV